MSNKSEWAYIPVGVDEGRKLVCRGENQAMVATCVGGLGACVTWTRQSALIEVALIGRRDKFCGVEISLNKWNTVQAKTFYVKNKVNDYFPKTFALFHGLYAEFEAPRGLC